MTVPPLNIISRSTPEIVISRKTHYIQNSVSTMANWITVDIVKRARARHELACNENFSSSASERSVLSSDENQ